MDLHFLWKAVIIVLGGTILLRIAGRKSISQMTLAQVVIMVGIGSLLVQPLVGKDIWNTLFVGLILVLTLVLVEIGQLKSDKIETFITGKSKIVIKDGEIQESQLKKLRLTVDQLEMKLRQLSIMSIDDVMFATLEPNGQLGALLKEVKQPATKGDILKILNEIDQLKQAIIPLSTSIKIEKNDRDTNHATTFSEVSKNQYQTEYPKRLQ